MHREGGGGGGMNSRSEERFIELTTGSHLYVIWRSQTHSGEKKMSETRYI